MLEIGMLAPDFALLDSVLDHVERPEACVKISLDFTGIFRVFHIKFPYYNTTVMIYLSFFLKERESEGTYEIHL